MIEALLLQGCDVLPPMHSPPLPNEVNTPHQRSQGKSKEKPARRKTANRFAVLNAFVDFALAGLDRSEANVWLVLYRDTKADGTARTSQADLARRAGVSDRTVRNAIKGLVGKGLLQVVYRGGIRRGASTYRVRSLPPNR
jgi:predicted DNA-binding transcriptional regulator